MLTQAQARIETIFIDAILYNGRRRGKKKRWPNIQIKNRRTCLGNGKRYLLKMQAVFLNLPRKKKQEWQVRKKGAQVKKITPASYTALQVSALTTVIHDGTQTPNTQIYAFLEKKNGHTNNNASRGLQHYQFKQQQ